jgi:hypothetical protein
MHTKTDLSTLMLASLKWDPLRFRLGMLRSFGLGRYLHKTHTGSRILPPSSSLGSPTAIVPGPRGVPMRKSSTSSRIDETDRTSGGLCLKAAVGDFPR